MVVIVVVVVVVAMVVVVVVVAVAALEAEYKQTGQAHECFRAHWQALQKELMARASSRGFQTHGRSWVGRIYVGGNAEEDVREDGDKNGDGKGKIQWLGERLIIHVDATHTVTDRDSSKSLNGIPNSILPRPTSRRGVLCI